MRKGVVGSLLIHAALLVAALFWALPPRAAAPVGRVALYMVDAPPAPHEERAELPELAAPAVVKEDFHAEPETEPVEFEPEVAEPALVQPRGVRVVRLARALPRTKPAPAPPPVQVRVTPRRAVKKRAPAGPTRGPVLLNLREAQPVYPRTALQRGLQGIVKLAVDVDREGRVENVEVETSSGHRSLDRAAVRAARKWSFRPALENGKRTPSRYVRTVRFRLVNG